MEDQDEIEKTTESKHGEIAPFEPEEATDHRANESPQAEEYSYRAMYENTPIMMHTIGANKELVSVNRNWLETMGYEEAEVIGRKSTEFMTEKSRRYSVEVAMPKFIKTGSAKDVACQMVKKTGK